MNHQKAYAMRHAEAYSPSPFPRSIQDQVDNLKVGTLGCAEIGIGLRHG